VLFPKTDTKTREYKGREFCLYTVEFENAVFEFFFEGDERKLGTLAIAVPKIGLTLGSSSILLGHRNTGIARLLAEHVAAKFQKMAVSSVFLYHDNDADANRALLKLAQSGEGE